jgi:lipoprotein-anchoring transpeptidase ErfK/SrfK
VSADYTEVFYDNGVLEYADTSATGTKSIVVDRSDQTLKAYDNGELFMEAEISTGLELTPTPRGIFYIFRKTPSRYMQGPLPYLVDQQSYDLPGVPWNLYFTEGGAAIHGTYWHNNFGNQQSHGCVNMRPEEAEKLYRWAELGTKVTVRD